SERVQPLERFQLLRFPGSEAVKPLKVSEVLRQYSL
ncbi:hypothetical protein A2U01_0021185, partial [Trifolium medium]|nr:hypothetical protein [Trifolium medium]